MFLKMSYSPILKRRLNSLKRSQFKSSKCQIHIFLPCSRIRLYICLHNQGVWDHLNFCHSIFTNSEKLILLKMLEECRLYIVESSIKRKKASHLNISHILFLNLTHILELKNAVSHYHIGPNLIFAILSSLSGSLEIILSKISNILQIRKSNFWPFRDVSQLHWLQCSSLPKQRRQK